MYALIVRLYVLALNVPTYFMLYVLALKDSTWASGSVLSELHVSIVQCCSVRVRFVLLVLCFDS